MMAVYRVNRPLPVLPILTSLLAASILPCHGGDFFTVVVLPDTQYYSSYWETIFFEQTHWACQCSGIEDLNVLFVSHLGDIVHRGNKRERDWARAEGAMSTLLKCGIPHGFLPGNHDIDSKWGRGEAYRYYDASFPSERYEGLDWYGGSHPEDTTRSNFEFFEYGGSGFVFLHLQYRLDRELFDWASGVLTDHSDRVALLSTHYAGNACSGAVNSWVEKLITDHCNLLLVFGGHVTGCGAERSVGVNNSCGEEAHVLVSNYQIRENGGDGWLRYYTFHPDEGTVCARTYSPTLGVFERDENSYFSVGWKPGNRTLGPGCTALASTECKSDYVAPGFVIATVWISSAFLILFYFILITYL